MAIDYSTFIFAADLWTSDDQPSGADIDVTVISEHAPLVTFVLNRQLATRLRAELGDILDEHNR